MTGPLQLIPYKPFRKAFPFLTFGLNYSIIRLYYKFSSLHSLSYPIILTNLHPLLLFICIVSFERSTTIYTSPLAALLITTISIWPGRNYCAKATRRYVRPTTVCRGGFFLK